MKREISVVVQVERIERDPKKFDGVLGVELAEATIQLAPGDEPRKAWLSADTKGALSLSVAGADHVVYEIPTANLFDAVVKTHDAIEGRG